MRRLAKPAHKEWRASVLALGDKCVVCGKGPKYNNCHHLIPHEFREFEYDIDNGIVLCPLHHTLGKYSAHKHPMWFSRWLRINNNKIYQQVIHRIRELEETYGFG